MALAVVVEHILDELCYGHGCSIVEWSNLVDRYHAAKDSERAHAEPQAILSNPEQESPPSKAQVWDAFRIHPSAVIGSYNSHAKNLTYDEILALPKDENPPTRLELAREACRARPLVIDAHKASTKKSVDDEVAPTVRPWIRVSRELQSQAIAGHDFSLDRIPMFEWLTLVEVARAREAGIIQPDMRKNTDQDKRSAPRRADFLVYKGYIVAKRVDVRGARTSHLTLKKFVRAPFDPTTLDPAEIASGMHPIPGHENWTGEATDPEVLVRCLIVLVKAFGVIRRSDLRTKMAVVGKPRQMKYLERFVRSLIVLGVLEKVKASIDLGEGQMRELADCIRFVRNITEDELNEHFRRVTASESYFRQRPSRAKPKSLEKSRSRGKSRTHDNDTSASGSESGTESDSDDETAVMLDSPDMMPEPVTRQLRGREAKMTARYTKEAPLRSAEQSTENETGATSVPMTEQFSKPSADESVSGRQHLAGHKLEYAELSHHAGRALKWATDRPGITGVFAQDRTAASLPVPFQPRQPTRPMVQTSVSRVNKSALPTNDALPDVEPPRLQQENSRRNTIDDDPILPANTSRNEPLIINVCGRMSFDGFISNVTSPRTERYNKSIRDTTSLAATPDSTLNQFRPSVAISPQKSNSPVRGSTIPIMDKPASVHITEAVPQDVNYTQAIVSSVIPKKRGRPKKITSTSAPVGVAPKKLGRPRKNPLATLTPAVIFTSHDQIMREAGQAGVFLDLPEFTSTDNPEDIMMVCFKSASLIPFLREAKLHESQTRTQNDKRRLSNNNDSASLSTPAVLEPSKRRRLLLGPPSPPQNNRAYIDPIVAVSALEDDRTAAPDPPVMSGQSNSRISSNGREVQMLAVRDVHHVEQLVAHVIIPIQERRELQGEYVSRIETPDLVGSASENEYSGDCVEDSVLQKGIHDLTTAPIPGVATIIKVTKDSVFGILYMSPERDCVTFSFTRPTPATFVMKLNNLTRSPKIQRSGSSMGIEFVLQKRDAQEAEIHWFQFLADSTALASAKTLVEDVRAAMQSVRAPAADLQATHKGRPSTTGREKPFVCDKCGGTWRNSNGLEYHLTKARVSCNPGYVPGSEPIPTISDKPLKRNKSPEDEEFIAKPHKKRRRTKEETSTVSLEASSPSALTTTQKHPIAPMITRHQNLKQIPTITNHAAAASKAGKGLKTTNDIASVSKASFTAPSVITDTPDNASHGATTKPPVLEKMVIDWAGSRKPDAQQAKYYREVILDLLTRNQGVFPGKRGVWYAFCKELYERDKTVKLQRFAICNAAINSLADSGKIQKIEFSFRGIRNGKATGGSMVRTVLALRNIDPLSTLVTDTKDKIKDFAPDHYCPPEFALPPVVKAKLDTMEGDFAVLGKHYKRNQAEAFVATTEEQPLPKDSAGNFVLTAPVYVSGLAGHRRPERDRKQSWKTAEATTTSPISARKARTITNFDAYQNYGSDDDAPGDIDVEYAQAENVAVPMTKHRSTISRVRKNSVDDISPWYRQKTAYMPAKDGAWTIRTIDLQNIYACTMGLPHATQFLQSPLSHAWTIRPTFHGNPKLRRATNRPRTTQTLTVNQASKNSKAITSPHEARRLQKMKRNEGLSQMPTRYADFWRDNVAVSDVVAKIRNTKSPLSTSAQSNTGVLSGRDLQFLQPNTNLASPSPVPSNTGSFSAGDLRFLQPNTNLYTNISTQEANALSVHRHTGFNNTLTFTAPTHNTESVLTGKLVLSNVREPATVQDSIERPSEPVVQTVVQTGKPKRPYRRRVPRVQQLAALDAVDAQRSLSPDTVPSEVYKTRYATALPGDLELIPSTFADDFEDAEMDMNHFSNTLQRRPNLASQVLPVAEEARLLFTVVVVRTLTGGIHRVPDWILISSLFPQHGLRHIQDCWPNVAVKHKTVLNKLISSFQDAYLEAYANEEIASIDYDNLLDYDWASLVNWYQEKMDHVLAEVVQRLPPSRDLLQRQYLIEDGGALPDRDSYFDGLVPVHRRLHIAMNSAYTVESSHIDIFGKTIRLSQLEIAESWVRASQMTDEETFRSATTQAILERMPADILEAAVEKLLANKVLIARNKGRPLPGRRYVISDSFKTSLRGTLNEDQLRQAATFKTELDHSFTLGNEVEISWLVKEGEVLAVTNLQAYRRLTTSHRELPNVDLGGPSDATFSGRAVNKELLRFGMTIQPTDAYVFDKDNMALLAFTDGFHDPPLEYETAIPVWVDINGRLIVSMWRTVLGAVMSVVVFRSGVSTSELARILAPGLQLWEVTLLLGWGTGIGMVETCRMGDTDGWTASEWWWLILGNVDRLQSTDT